jgi:hypothetical protein
VAEFLGWIANLFAIPIGVLDARGLEVNWYNSVDKRQFYVLGISRTAIDLRNSAKFQGIKPDLFGLKINFKYMLKSHLQNLLHVHKKRDDPLVFTET